MRRHRGFTLIELLVVVGIIALLLAMLMPSLARAREQAKQVQCLSNMRQIACAFVGYINNNRGKFPRPAVEPEPEDWIYWSGGRNPDEGVIVPYLGTRFQPEIYRCPSDDCTAHLWGYNYSYSVNEIICSWKGRGRDTLNISQIYSASDKILLIDESIDTVDDGCWAWQWLDGGGRNVISNRHDKNAERVSDPNAGRGNVAFVDGHAAFIARSASFDPHYYDALLPN